MNKLLKIRLQYLSVILFSTTLFFSCASISGFDQYAYLQSTSIKVDILNLMDKATEDYSLHVAEIKEVNTKIEKIYEYEVNRPKNEISAAMWMELKSPDKELYGSFIKFWNENKKCSESFIKEAKEKIGKNIDRISQLESKKIKK